MAIGVDTSDRKPRKFRGTPAYRVRNYISLGILTLGLGFGVLFSVLPGTRSFRHFSQDYAYTVTEAQKQHAALMHNSFAGYKTGTQLRELKKELESQPTY